MQKVMDAAVPGPSKVLALYSSGDGSSTCTETSENRGGGSILKFGGQESGERSEPAKFC